MAKREAQQQQDFATMILDNLKKAGVQNTRKAERLAFDRLDPYAGTWLHAAGQFLPTSRRGKPASAWPSASARSTARSARGR